MKKKYSQSHTDKLIGKIFCDDRNGIYIILETCYYYEGQYFVYFPSINKTGYFLKLYILNKKYNRKLC